MSTQGPPTGINTTTTTTPLPPQRGLLIVIEGLDRSGKTTQCTRLLHSLTSTAHAATLQKFPDRTTPTGTLINQYLLNQTQPADHAIHLIFSSNRWEARASILTALATGTTVIVDRYSFSGAVYSAAKGNTELGLEWAWAPEVGLPRPDLVVFLEVDEEVQMLRGGFGEERYERVEMQRVVRELFNVVLARVVGDMGVRVERVDAGVSLEVVEGRVWEAVMEVMREERGEVGVLRPLG